MLKFLTTAGLWSYSHLCQQLVEGLKFLSYMQASKSACHSFMDAGGRHMTPGSEKKDLLLMSIVTSSVFVFSCICSPCPQVPQELCDQGQEILDM